MQSYLKISAAAAVLIALGACASQPEPPPPVEEAPPVEQPAPPPPPPPPPVVEEPTGPAPGSLEDFRVNVGERVYFDLNGDALDTDDQSLLRQHALKYTSDPSVRILVAGNCDERGTREYNLALGERRAAKVKDYLVSLGIAPNRIDTISYGKERPIAAESNEQAWAMNRNGFIQVVSPNS